MTGQDMLEAIVYLDPVFIEEADDDMQPIKKMSPIKRWAAIAACLVLLLSVGIGTVAAEAKEYKAAIQFFDEYTLPTEGLTRGEIKAVYHDITNKSFTYKKTADVIENSLTPEQKVEYVEIKGNAGNKTSEDLWDYKMHITTTEPAKNVVKSGISYSILDWNPGGYTITGCDETISGQLVIPDTINGLPVIAIGTRVFSNCTGLTSVTIPEGMKNIRDYAFANCSHLTKIIIPESVTNIGDGAFIGCRSLTGITIPERVTEIRLYTFSDCSNLESVTLPEGLNSIENGAFRNCASLKSITIPKYVSSIGASAFQNCSSLSIVTLPEYITSISGSAFDACSSLVSITIPKNVKSIYRYAFRGCSSLTSITLPEGVTTIDNEVFRDCSSLVSITIPKSVTEIFYSAFFECNSLWHVLYQGTEDEWNRIIWKSPTVSAPFDPLHAPSAFNDVTQHYHCAGDKCVSVQIIKPPTSAEAGTFILTCSVCGETTTKQLTR